MDDTPRRTSSGFGRTLVLAGPLLGLALISQAVQAQATATGQDAVAAEATLAAGHQYAIPAGELARAIDQLAEQSGLQIIYESELVEGKQAPALSGTYSVRDALTHLLEGSHLDWQFVNGNTFVLSAKNGAAAGEGAAVAAAIDPAADAGAPGAIRGGVSSPVAIEAARQSGIEEIIVTGQKREERIQDVPIAISAFTMENLDAQKIEGGFDLLKAVPNVTFSKSNFTGYNFQIRGIGTQAISATTDPGVAVSFNNTTLIVNRLFEQEYLDIERVEVLRGPQGTLFGRNATAGVINVITAKPEMGITKAEFKIEAGNYGAERFRGFLNVPIGTSDTLAMRGAFALTKRDGYGRNLAYSDPEIQEFILNNDRAPISSNIDNRDLWTGRFSLGWQPTDSFRANLIYERFEEDDRRMRSTKQLCNHHDGNILLYDVEGNPVRVADAIHPEEAQRNHNRYFGQVTQGCLPKSLFDKGDITSTDPNDHGAYGTPNGNSMPFVRAGRGGTFSVHSTNAPALDGYPDCAIRGSTLVTQCVADPMRMPYGQSRGMRDIFSLIDPRYEATSELVELSLDVDVNDSLTFSSQTVYMENDLFSTQDFLRFKTLPIFNDSSLANMQGNATISHRRGVTPKGIFNDPQLGKSDRLLMQDVSQQVTSQFSQEFRIVSSFDGPLNYSVGANYTRFENTADYFVFINTLPAFVQSGAVYSGQPFVHNNVFGLWGGTAGPGPADRGMTSGCGPYMADVRYDELGNILSASCVHVQQGSIDDVRNDPQGHHFFLSRNPFELQSAGLFGELYYAFTPALKLTAGLRMNWDRKTFTPTPSQTMLADWRGRLSGGAAFNVPSALPQNADLTALCHPRSPTRRVFHLVPQVPCALAGLGENGRGYPTLPDIVQEWRVPTGRIGLDWKLDTGFTDETLVYAFYTRGYKAGGANPPTQSAPSGILLAAAQGVAAPPIFDAEYVNAFELGTKNRLMGGAITLNGTAFYYDYKDYQVSKIVDRTAINENFDATIWGLELETVFAPTPDTLFNASVGYLRTRIGDDEKSLDLMDRAQGGNHHYVDPNWANVDCGPGAGNANHFACVTHQVQVGVDEFDDPIYEDRYTYRDGFDQWVVVRPTLTQASSCIAPAVLVYRDFAHYSDPGTGGTYPEDALSRFCPGGPISAGTPDPQGYLGYSAFTSAPNSAAGFLADVSGNELPNAPRFTVSLGAQHTYWLPGGQWSATARVDWYWQDKSYHRVYNTEYDRLQDWTNTNVSFWVSNERWGLTVEAYIKNLLDETPVTGAFLNSDDTGLSTNVFTLDPRLVGLSIRKRF